MASFDDLKRAAFDGIEFPVKEVRVKGGLRDHVHEFPHTPGGKPERMGRKLYTIEMSVPFLANLIDPKWKDLWPTALATLRSKFEREIVSQLYVPTIGTIHAYCFDWEQTMRAEIRSGEMGMLHFREDQSDEFLTSELIKTSPRGLDGQVKNLKQQAAVHGLNPSIFDSIQDAANDVLAVLDQVELGAALIESKLLMLAGICDDFDRKLNAFQDPSNYRLLEALKEVWASAQKLLYDIAGKESQLRTYVTPTEMSVTEVSAAVFHTAARGMDILQLNPIEDAFAIPAGTSLRYYEDAA